MSNASTTLTLETPPPAWSSVKQIQPGVYLIDGDEEPVGSEFYAPGHMVLMITDRSVANMATSLPKKKNRRLLADEVVRRVIRDELKEDPERYRSSGAMIAMRCDSSCAFIAVRPKAEGE